MDSKPPENLRFFTFTNVPEDPARARFCWQRLIRMFRRYFRFEYLKVIEVGARTGMHHWHVLIDCDRDIPKNWVGRMAGRFGLGYIVDTKRISNKGIVGYLCSYLSKAGCPEGFRKVTSSKGFLLKKLKGFVEGYLLVRPVVPIESNGAASAEAWRQGWSPGRLAKAWEELNLKFASNGRSDGVLQGYREERFLLSYSEP